MEYKNKGYGQDLKTSTERWEPKKVIKVNREIMIIMTTKNDLKKNLAISIYFCFLYYYKELLPETRLYLRLTHFQGLYFLDHFLNLLPAYKVVRHKT